MKFSIFSDLHYCPGLYKGGTLNSIRYIQKRAEESGSEFIIHAGDFCHGPSLVPEAVELYNNFHIPSYHALGNHDSDKTSYEETLKIYGMSDGYYYFDKRSYRFIVCNPNYYCLGDKYIAYSLGNYFKYDAERDYMPPEQLSWLKETIDSSPYPCILISHESFHREADGVKNQKEVRKIINEANRRKPHSVLLCINGHDHVDFIRILDQVCYFELNSTSYHALPKSHNLYPEALCKEYRGARSTIIYNDPVHAVITLEGNTITIEGMESTFYMDIDREMTGNTICDGGGRYSTPCVQSAKITL